MFLQSVTVPLQGLLNAIVYGWTRGDFLYIMAVSSSHSYHTDLEGGAAGSSGCVEPALGQERLDRDTPELLSGTYNS